MNCTCRQEIRMPRWMDELSITEWSMPSYRYRYTRETRKTTRTTRTTTRTVRDTTTIRDTTTTRGTMTTTNIRGGSVEGLGFLVVVLDLKSEIAGTPLPMEIASRDSDFSKAIIADADPSFGRLQRA